jgi:hypothetical protein
MMRFLSESIMRPGAKAADNGGCAPPQPNPFRLSDVFAQPFPGTDNEALRLDAESATVTRAIDTVI